ncbi:MAG: tetratricopeptide repeat protein [Terriglobia bacterium]
MMKSGGRYFVLALLLGVMGGEARPATLPALPALKLDNTFSAVRRQIQQAYAAARAHPAEPASNGKLAMILDTYQQYAGAAICYRRAHRLEPSSFQWVYDLGYVEMKLGEYDRAAAAFRAALKMNPGYLPATMNLAESLLSAGQLDASGKLFEEIVQKYPDSAEAQYGLGRVEAAQGNAQAAAQALEKACELFPEYGGAHYALALAYRKLGQPQKAATHFAAYQSNVTTAPPIADPLRAAVEQLNQGPLELMRRGLALGQAGDIDGAIQEYQKAIGLDPQLVQAHINLIQLYARASKYEKAEQEYQAAVSLDPNRADCYYNYGVLMFGLNRFSEAEQAFRRAIAINPYYAEAHNNLGFLIERQGHLDQAIEEFRKAVEDRPNYRLARFHIGQILVNQRKYAEAIAEFQKILTPNDATTPGYLYALGATYARAGDLQNALTYIRKARDEAAARGQTQLLASIDGDLKSLEQDLNQH